ncbi:hypothetical protein [Salibacterium aidingense]|uniref:hypothetical protein n=1 Tax=Salibacterium aidingense TaxID=384933 RepID=UPI0004088847|nr:hypothetical protein [Salibacterium aidingense]
MKYPIHEHIMFQEKRETYARKFHLLAEELKACHIDISLLHDVIDASHDVGDLQADIAYRQGYEKGWQNGKANRYYEKFREELLKKAAE